jgi:hypothetical protein
MQITGKFVVKSAFTPEDGDSTFVKCIDTDTYGDFKFAMDKGNSVPEDAQKNKIPVQLTGEFEGNIGQKGLSLRAIGLVKFEPLKAKS